MLAGLLAMLSLLLVACGGGGDKAEEEEEAPRPTVTEQAEPEPRAEREPTIQAEPEPEILPAGAIGAVADVEQAVVRIVAQGTFRDPEFGELLNVAGSGTGFIIDPSGLAVTNNHVVTGAALLEVFFSDDDRPRNARILGVSECSDLAVIQIEGDGHPFLQWYQGDTTPGLQTFAAGYPLGDPEYTLTGGIVSKADADGESVWASVDFVLEHDATLLGGNSGGPLVTEDGRVVGINYAGSFEGQSFAIRADEAQRILDRLIADEDVTSIGVNGQAILGPDFSGIWVASVASGSPADDLGIQSGDIITRMEGLLLATDGTMSDYCQILRTQGPGAVLSVEVLRSDTGQVLEGRLNAGEQLAESFSFAAELQEEFEPAPAAARYSGFVRVEDETGLLVVEIPIEWADVDGTAWMVDGDSVGPSISAAGNRGAFFGTWTEPGVFFAASQILTQRFDENALLDFAQTQFNFSSYNYLGRFPYDDPAYTGFFDQFEGCGGEEVVYISLAAVPQDRSFIISVQIQLVTEADVEALDRILASFFVIDP